jgi:hypothetical protein
MALAFLEEMDTIYCDWLVHGGMNLLVWASFFFPLMFTTGIFSRGSWALDVMLKLAELTSNWDKSS